MDPLDLFDGVRDIKLSTQVVELWERGSVNEDPGIKIFLDTRSKRSERVKARLIL